MAKIKIPLSLLVKEAVEITPEKINEERIHIEKNDIQKLQIEIEKQQEELESLKSDRILKIEIKDFIKCIVCVIMIACVILIAGDIVYFILKDKHLYSEWFLAVIFSSQLVVLPLSLLLIITRHLFPADKNK